MTTSDTEATARPWEVPADLVECCQELLDWSRTGLLAGGAGGAVRARAESLNARIDEHHRLRVAEDSVQVDAVRFVVQAGQAVNDRDALLAQVAVMREALEQSRAAMFETRAASIAGCELGYSEPSKWADRLYVSHGGLTNAIKAIDAALSHSTGAA